ncbi:uncharacterized protein LOC127107746 [Lathyrus oleraceus]|uniref:uncharacterized protein LOC127107746 n=1 Tax=Pisum sativum TaxID=3888 RepID=UPI0021CF3892|nr:uncharacterized protein LOC127107746 [Pisum sativum]
MRSLYDQEFAEFFIRIGDGVEPTKLDDMVRLPLHIAIPWEGEHSIQVLIQHIFPNLELHGWDAPYMVQRAILTPTNDDVQKLNDMIIDQFPGEEHNLLSFDEVEGDHHNLYQQEFLNSITQGSLPPHILKIKKSAPLMLLRNLDPRYGLCNGTRGVSHTTTRVLTRKGKLKGEDGGYTRNVVYKQILLSHPQFFKSQERIDKGIYEELIRIFIRYILSFVCKYNIRALNFV